MVVVAPCGLTGVKIVTLLTEEGATKTEVVSVKVTTEVDDGSPRTVPVTSGAVTLIMLAKLIELTTATSTDMAVRFSLGVCDEALSHGRADVCP